MITCTLQNSLCPTSRFLIETQNTGMVAPHSRKWLLQSWFSASAKKQSGLVGTELHESNDLIVPGSEWVVVQQNEVVVLGLKKVAFGE